MSEQQLPQRRVVRSSASQETLTAPVSSRSASTNTLHENDCTPLNSDDLCGTCGIPLTDKEKKAVPFHSRLLKDRVNVAKPWLLLPPDPREKWLWILPVVGLVIGNIIGAFIIYNGYKSVVNHNYCPVYEDDFHQGLDRTIWDADMQLGSHITGEFVQTTDDAENLFVDENGVLNLVATLQDGSMMEEDMANIDLGSDCTAEKKQYCHATTRLSNGSVVPPIRSARITTRLSHSIKYGRVQVTAKMSKGDWLWPSIRMRPVQNTYGSWPRSGQIDMAVLRGNNHSYPLGGNHVSSSMLHWGPDAAVDAWYKTYEKRNSGHTTFADDYFIFGLEWSERFLFTWVNSRLMQVLYMPFESKPMWDVARFDEMTDGNGTTYNNPWAETGRFNTPFDHPFYLEIGLSAGGTNGWFKDGKADKPWTDDSPTAMREFWDARDIWYPTWTQPSMQIKKVAIWQECNPGVVYNDESSEEEKYNDEDAIDASFTA